VRIELVGGLGNQLFQWAAANYYAQATKKVIILDLTYCSNRFKVHKSSIKDLEFDSAFTLPLETSNNPISAYGGEFLASRNRYLNKARNLIQGRDIQRTTGYVENLEDKNPKILRGYFQTYKYLENLSKNPVQAALSLKNTNYSKKESSEVAINIRRGDYQALKQTFGMLSNQYYLNAIDRLKQIVKPSRIVIFSNDIEAAESLAKEIGPLGSVFRSDFHDSDAAILIALSRFNYVVTANSSFSWWAASLNNKKTVVYPKPWFRTLEEPKDLIPPDWIPCVATWID
jgi:hypothetical protein